VSVVDLSLLGAGIGFVMGIPAVIIKSKSKAWYDVYAGVIVVLFGMILSFRYAQRVLPVDLDASALQQPIFKFFTIAIIGFWIPLLAGCGLCIWLSSLAFKSARTSV